MIVAPYFVIGPNVTWWSMPKGFRMFSASNRTNICNTAASWWDSLRNFKLRWYVIGCAQTIENPQASIETQGDFGALTIIPQRFGKLGIPFAARPCFGRLNVDNRWNMEEPNKSSTDSGFKRWDQWWESEFNPTEQWCWERPPKLWINKNLRIYHFHQHGCLTMIYIYIIFTYMYDVYFAHTSKRKEVQGGAPPVVS